MRFALLVQAVAVAVVAACTSGGTGEPLTMIDASIDASPETRPLPDSGACDISRTSCPCEPGATIPCLSGCGALYCMDGEIGPFSAFCGNQCDASTPTYDSSLDAPSEGDVAVDAPTD